jgi:hypothetical protein
VRTGGSESEDSSIHSSKTPSHTHQHFEHAHTHSQVRSAEAGAAHMAGWTSGCTAAKAATPAARVRPPRATDLREAAEAVAAEARAALSVVREEEEEGGR